MESVRQVDVSRMLGATDTKLHECGQELLDGLRETGFVRIVGHGIPQALILNALKAFERFFALPEKSKRSCGGIAGGQRGYTPFGREHARNHAWADQKEFFHVGQEQPALGSPSHQYPANVWPRAIPELRPAALSLYRALETTADVLLQGVALACQLKKGTFSDMLQRGNSILRAAHYPSTPKDADPEALRAAPHEDINLITLLCGATDPGLEILSPDNRWVPVKSLPGEIVADVGDMLARLTNGQLPATTHRVAARGAEKKRSRYALPFFAHPRPECSLNVLERFIPKGETPVFRDIDAAGFLEQRLEEIGLLSQPGGGKRHS